jgi:hypothetical protein
LYIANVEFTDHSNEISVDLSGTQVVDPSSNYELVFTFNGDFGYCDIDFEPGTWLLSIIGSNGSDRACGNIEANTEFYGDMTVSFVSGNFFSTSTNAMHFNCNFIVNSGVGTLRFLGGIGAFNTSSTYTLYANVMGVPAI